MKVTRKYTARVVDNKTLQPSTVEDEVELSVNAPTSAVLRTAQGRASQAGKTVTSIEVDGEKGGS